MTAASPEGYPNDPTTHTLISCALAVATMLEYGPKPPNTPPARELVKAAQRWRESHTTNKGG